MILETERLVLRAPTAADTDAAEELAGDAEVMRFIGGTLPADEFVAWWVERWRVDGLGPFVVERREDGRFLGRVGIFFWDTRNWSLCLRTDAGEFAQPELGWAIVRTEWSKGYATEAARAARDWAGSEHGLANVVSVISPENSASQQVARRLGGSPGETVMLFEVRPAEVWRY